ncbi:MAG: transglutaminase family protein [Betaproteobacteria bacterium]|nr:MAG: transglutaminase family protein [Betaproteobacteria bacterium]
MSIHVALNHVTHYRYDRSVLLGPHVVRLRPAPHCRTRILSYSMRVAPSQHFVNWQQDPQSNYLARLVFPEKTAELRIEVDLVAEMAVLNPFDFFLEPHAETVPFEYTPEQQRELAPHLTRLPATRRFADYLAGIRCEETPTLGFLVELNRRLQRDIAYLVRLEPGVQTPEETLASAAGSCRDSGWLLVQLLRHLGLAARFVSGYLVQLTPDVKALDGPSGPTSDFTDLHAWCEVYLPGAGWIGLDPTSGLLAGEGHIPLACSPEPSAAAPVTGAHEKCEVTFEHSMKVERIWEAPRVTKPYTEAQWIAIDALGKRIDQDLRDHDVRLTQGGEPTFVAVGDRDGAEWNTEAMGSDKRRLAADLLLRLKAHYAPRGLLHYGQGKWHPGEQLPRWSLNAFWRRDGEPIWTDTALFADEQKSYGATEGQARTFLQDVADRLGVDSRHIFPAFEDAFYYLWRERRLPSNVDPFDSKLSDPLERERLRKVFAQGLDKTVGHVLPLGRDPAAARWRSGPWFLRDERCYLIPGDSPIGYRLPLDSLPWVSQADYPWIYAPGQGAAFGPLPGYGQIRRRVGAADEGAQWMTQEHDPSARAADSDGVRASRREPDGGPARDGPVPTSKQPGSYESAAWITRTAMCAEPRDGRMCIFMPPTATIEDYLEIVAAVEAAARALAIPVALEGYEPPRDPRLIHLRVTPDPGVIEVNIQPAGDWNELVEQTSFLYEAAHESRLSAEKFMLDGRHTGTGGGNHVALGGATPNDSPFLRRPDLLKSLIGYWHNHPSLSFLFSGLFVGPTSPAPRIDEARNVSVYEIELAFGELERLAEAGRTATEPWQAGRVLRNLLIDVTGNTRRAEFCIDKLYSPEGATGCLGLLELRAFEMPPHARMSLAQQLLLRALVSRFWQHPYRPARLKRWGTELHDRFMLPHFVWDDFCDVLEEMTDFGYPMPADWFAPHFEFRFPRLGDFAARNVDVELRLALEPWHVLGEEDALAGAVRYVDSSLERMQVKVMGLIDDRHVLTCNGHALPLHPTGNVGEYVAGVRYKAWWPASSLHPTIAPHTPLSFDLVDTWMQRSLGGCQYHVSHPGGRNYSSFPVNAYEAEARRLARFFRIGHTPGVVRPSVRVRDPDFPFTLDLRRS